MSETIAEQVRKLQARLQLLEDEREISRLVSAYGPLVDHGAADEVADLWTEDGVYEVDGYRMSGRDEIEAMVHSAPHQGFIAGGCSHFQGPVTVTVDGDSAVGACYSLLVLHSEKGFVVKRATAHHLLFARTAAGWKIRRRTSRAQNGDQLAQLLAAAGVRGTDLDRPE